jgi:glycosyltransferase involved in cell wall biosynthesis
VNNRNYARFIRDAIDSALAQDHPATEVVVVDDGSTDDSREVIAEYGNRITAVLKDNGGQASAFNAGFAAAHGEVVLFLDADDLLLPTAVSAVARCLAPGVAKVHWPLREVDGLGRDSGRIRPRDPLPAGDLRGQIAAEGPDGYVSPPTSGNAFSSAFLERVLPMPEADFELSADAYLYGLAPLFGTVEAIQSPQGLYRLHGSNHYLSQNFEEKLERDVRRYETRCRAMAEHCAALGMSVDAGVLLERSWLHRLRRAVRELAELVPPGGSFLLVDDDQWGMGPGFAGRRRIPFPELDGEYGGLPAGDEAAIAELERLRTMSPDALVVAWPAFWWLDYYEGFRRHLRDSLTPVLDNDELVVFAIDERA